jgi:hypothetical protein
MGGRNDSISDRALKYKNIKKGGYHSTKEWKRAQELKLMELAGIISDLREQVKFELIPAQRIDGKCVERACCYVADFVYMKDGEIVVEDVKGIKTPHYIDKRKMMLFFHGMRILET